MSKKKRMGGKKWKNSDCNTKMKIKIRFMYITHNGEQLHVSREFDCDDDELYDNVEFVERYYGVRCRIFVTEVAA